MKKNAPKAACAVALAVLSATASAQVAPVSGKTAPSGQQPFPLNRTPQARNVIFFVGDGMGVSTVTATRIYAVGVDGQLAVDQFPFTALSRTYSADYITPDSADTMTSMMTGSTCNSGVIGFMPDTEILDFNADGDGLRPWTVAELAKQAGMKVGVVSTARITHATPAACYSHINFRDLERDIALQALPTDPTYNDRLVDGVDILMGGGRQFFVPAGTADEEGGSGSRTDGRDLRQEFQSAGYSYIWNQTGFDALTSADLPVLGLFERSHMEWEYDRPLDAGGEPSVLEMTTKSIELLQQATADSDKGYFLMVESGRIDHAHHATNAFRALTDTDAFDQAIAAAVAAVDLRDTLIIVTADHSHVFTIAGYPLRPIGDLGYSLPAGIDIDPDYLDAPESNILDVAFEFTGTAVEASTDSNGAPYTVLGYTNGASYRGPVARLDPRLDSFPGLTGGDVFGPTDPNYLQEVAVPLGSETHSGEEVAIYAIGRGAGNFRGTVKNTFIAEVMREVLGLADRPAD
jgi:alkaline phosphatase